MDISDIIIGCVKAIVWPLVVLVIVIVSLNVFRQQIANLLSRIKEAKGPGGWSVDFQQNIEDAKILSTQVKNQPPPKNKTSYPTIPLTNANSRMIELGLKPTTSGLDFNYYTELARRDPILALAGLRIEIEVLARNLAKGWQIPTDGKESVRELLQLLFKNHAMTFEQFQLTDMVLRFGNAAIHGKLVTRKEAESIIDVAKSLAEQYLSWLSWGFQDDWQPS